MSDYASDRAKNISLVPIMAGLYAGAYTHFMEPDLSASSIYGLEFSPSVWRALIVWVSSLVDEINRVTVFNSIASSNESLRNFEEALLSPTITGALTSVGSYYFIDTAPGRLGMRPFLIGAVSQFLGQSTVNLWRNQEDVNTIY